MIAIASYMHIAMLLWRYIYIYKLLSNYSCVICLQTKSCYNDYSNYFNLTYHQSQPVTHALLRQFYNGFILHRRFIQEKLLVLWINRHLRRQLNRINRELNQNIARLYHVVSARILL